MYSKHQQDLRTFEDWYGVCDEGYPTRKQAEERKWKVDSAQKGATGEVSYFSEVKDRFGDGKYWVYVKRVIDYAHPDRLAAGL